MSDEEEDFKAKRRRVVPRSLVKKVWPFLGKPRRKGEAKLEEANPREPRDGKEGKENCLCPVCGISLIEVSPTLLGRQAHVNACVDKGTARSFGGACAAERVETASGREPSPRGSPPAGPRPRDLSPAVPPLHPMRGSKAAPGKGRGGGADAVPWFIQKQQAHVIRGTPGPFAVDCFGGRQSTLLAQKGTTSWFLSHFHSDHYVGLKKTFSNGQIYCTMTTAKLVHHILGVPLEAIYVLELGKPCAIQGVKVTALDANHCPGACMFLFEPAGQTPTLHTGDARLVGDKMKRMQTLSRVKGNCTLTLDTTYCSLRYNSFPSQARVIEAIANVVKAEVASNPKALVLVGSYTIGKEGVFFGIAEALGTKVYIGAKKRRVMECLDLEPRLEALVTPNDTETNIHAVPLFHTKNQKRMEAILKYYKGRYTGIIAICPTGWSLDSSAQSQSKLTQFSPQGKGRANFISCRRKGKVVTYSVPYSEHSSFEEMRSFVSWLQPKEVVPFVKVSDEEAFRQLTRSSSSSVTAIA
ncbi:DNA cross-link repair protein [Chloropicon primus]|uniref:DNA cross-link repair protein n=1 Tax=Chloropicon primus TaxID=1764295 RepID=A0A5B8MM74_9CHLO|nr:DNA cross-link repair protein [Chloropicon primus]|eukprot:QDZ20400.1 DNA cross-link repair protein [Chloropicon primus]